MTRNVDEQLIRAAFADVRALEPTDQDVARVIARAADTSPWRWIRRASKQLVDQRSSRRRVRRAPAGSISRRLRSGLAAAPAALAVLIAVVIASVALVVLSHHHQAYVSSAVPALSSPPPYVSPTDPAMRYINPIFDPEHGKQYPACRPAPGAGLLNRSGVVSHAAPTQLLAILHVLRRHATVRDRPPGRYELSHLLRGAQVIYVNYIRLAGVIDGVRYYFVPEEYTSPFGFASACAAAEQAALRRELPRIPERLRAHTEQALADLIAGRRYESEPHQSLEIQAYGGGGIGGTGAGTALDISQQGSISTDGNTVVGVVPDRVATVRLHFPTGEHGGRWIIVHPVNNLFAVPAPSQATHTFPDRIVWRDSRGTPIRRLTESYS
jgi:hypothetical protein